MFRKSWVSVCGPTDDIVRPGHVRLLDYEVELGLVLRATVDAPRTVERADLPDLVGALVIANDVSARDVQLPEGQWYRAKSYRTFTPLGPFLFVPDAHDWERLTELELRLSVNDELRQRAAVDDMVFGPAESLADLSHWEVLAPGDVLLTGTPGGVALRPPRPIVQRLAGLLPDALRWNLFVAGQLRRREYLQPGDLVHATIATPDGAITLGEQRNEVVAD
jgi:2-keto-4-pentenoate hydratase/2-oxohepta-3-ene-1,7-dioic acid hydratase in catechol pathway